MSVLCVLSFCLICVCLCDVDPMIPEPVYVLNMDSPIYVCPDELSQSFVDTSEVEINRYNESTTVMTGVVKLLQNLEKHTVVEMLIEKETSGRYELMISTKMCDICAEVNNPDSIYHDYLKYFWFPTECPFVAGPYDVDNFIADTRKLPVNGANVGRYQATMNFFRNPSGDCVTDMEFIACLKLDLVIEPV